MADREEKFKELFQLGKYNQLIKLAKDDTDREDYNQWMYYYVIKAFYKQNEYRDAVTLGKECIRKFKNLDSRIYNSIGYAIYMEYIKEYDAEKYSIDRLIKAVDFICIICKQEAYSPYELTINKGIKIIYASNLNEDEKYPLMDKWLSKINVDMLSMEGKEANIDGKKVKLSSPKEDWYCKKTKVLFNLKSYEQCIEVSNEALKTIGNITLLEPQWQLDVMEDRNQFHNKNEKWIIYRMAGCYMALGDNQRAKEILMELSKIFKHWSVYKKLYEIEILKGDFNKALQFAAKSALIDNQYKSRINMYKDLGVRLIENNAKDEGQLLLRLVSLIREEEQWKKDLEIEALIEDSHIREADFKSVSKELKTYWLEEKYLGEVKLEGNISRIFVGNRNGLIDNCNKEYYFTSDNFLGNANLIKVGDKVRFYEEIGFDMKKKKESLKAIEIEVME